MSIQSLWIIFSVCLLLDLLFAALRASLLYARSQFLNRIEEGNQEGVAKTQNLLSRSHLRITLRMGVAGSHFCLAGIVCVLGVNYYILTPSSVWLVLAGMVGVALLVMAFEFAIEALMLKNIEKWAIRFTPIGYVMDFLLRPYTWLLEKLLGPPTVLHNVLESGVIEDELKEWVKDDTQDSDLEKDERQMIYSIFQFGDTLCREIMVPRIDIFALEADTLLPEAIKFVNATGHSRVPVYDDSIDNIIGVLYVKDLLRVDSKDQSQMNVRSFLRKVYFVPEAKKVSELLREMQTREVHMAVVVDEYGGTAGLVTMEDIVEEIVGEIRDEYDQAEELLYQQLDQDAYLLHGRITLDDLNDLLDTDFQREDTDTLAGYIYGEIGRIPSEGEQIEVEGWLMTIIEVRGRRIKKVRAERRVEETEKDDQKNEDVER